MELHGDQWNWMHYIVVSMEFHGTCPLNSIEIDLLIPHGMPWEFFHGNRWNSMEVFLTVCAKLFKGAMSRYFLPF